LGTLATRRRLRQRLHDAVAAARRDWIRDEKHG
jgi:hypothetical protein